MRLAAVLFLSGCYSPTVGLNPVPADNTYEATFAEVEDADCSGAPVTRLNTPDEVSHCDNCRMPSDIDVVLRHGAEQVAECRRSDDSVYVIYLAFGMNRTNCPCGQDTQLGRLGLSH